MGMSKWARNYRDFRGYSEEGNAHTNGRAISRLPLGIMARLLLY